MTFWTSLKVAIGMHVPDPSKPASDSRDTEIEQIAGDLRQEIAKHAASYRALKKVATAQRERSDVLSNLLDDVLEKQRAEVEGSDGTSDI
jgi:hypothetical protein